MGKWKLKWHKLSSSKEITVVVIGGSFGGMTAAIELKRKGGNRFRVILLDKSSKFLFIPSLIWVPFGRREMEDISFDKTNILTKKGVEFIHEEVISIDAEKQSVSTAQQTINYDHLVIATGPKVDFDFLPGLRNNSNYIGTPKGALNLREELKKFKDNPGPIVIGATQEAGCMGAAYEFLFNVEKWLREEGIRKKVDLYWITPEDYLGHFGIDGMPMGESMLKAFMKMFNINYRVQVGIKEIKPDSVVLSTGEEIKSKLTSIMPPFRGVDCVSKSPTVKADVNGFIPVEETYRHKEIDNVWAAGIAVQVPIPFKCENIPYSVPKTGYPSDVSGKIVAENIIRVTSGRNDLKKKSWGNIPGLCIMDAGKKEVLIFSDKLFKPRNFAIMVPNVLYDFTKVFVEQYFLWKSKKGYSWLP